jgi:molecular chaperone DnaJ
MARDDHYTVLGLTPPVGVAEIRRAYRLLALRHHPDRAGPAATATFQRIAEAYRVLSDPHLRTTYDAGLPPPATQAASGPDPIPHPGAARATASTGQAPAAPAAHATATLILRLCGSLAALSDRRIVRAHPGGGLLDLFINRDEARLGGVAAINMPLTVPCPTCGGIASPRGVWCRRCEFAGSVVEEITICVPIPALARDGLTCNVELDRLGDLPALTVRLRVT